MKNYVLFRQFTSVVLLNTKVQLSYYQIESECCFKEKHSEVFDGRSSELQSHDQKFLETQTVVISMEKLKKSGVTLGKVENVDH